MLCCVIKQDEKKMMILRDDQMENTFKNFAIDTVKNFYAKTH